MFFIQRLQTFFFNLCHLFTFLNVFKIIFLNVFLHLWLVCCRYRGKAVPVHVAGVRLAICSVGRTSSSLPQTHRRQAVRLQGLRHGVRPLWPPYAAHETTSTDDDKHRRLNARPTVSYTPFTRWSWLYERSSRQLVERSTNSFVNVCNITPFKWPDSQLIKPAVRALDERS